MIPGAAIGMAKEKMNTLTVNGMDGTIACKGDKITVPVDKKITANDKLYKIIAKEVA